MKKILLFLIGYCLLSVNLSAQTRRDGEILLMRDVIVRRMISTYS